MSNEHPIQRVAILGDGVAAWLAALSLAKKLSSTTVVVVNGHDASDAEIRAECGERSLPTLRAMHRALGVDERDFMRTTHATFTLGTEHIGWGHRSSYFLPLGNLGASLEGVPFHHHWLRAAPHDPLADYSLCAVAARQGRFVHPSPDASSILSTLDYGYHFDAVLYAQYLQAAAERAGVRALRARVVEAALHDDGSIESLILDTGERVEAELFIDASGARATLVGDALRVPFESWSHWLPCNRSLSVHCSSSGDARPHSVNETHNAGWRWQIPLQRRTSTGLVYCSKDLDDERAMTELRAALGNSETFGAIECQHLVNGRRVQLWHRNCIALGLAAGYLEPLAPANLHLAHRGISCLLALWPHGDRCETERDEYNRLLGEEHERARDVVIAHYVTAIARDTPFWRSVRSAQLPSLLEWKLRLFENRGRVVLYDGEVFDADRWASLLLGQGVRPKHADPLAATLPSDRVAQQLGRMKTAIAQAAQSMPLHAKIIQHHCAAPLT